MPSPLKKPESMYDIIFEAVTKKREAVQENAKKCKQLFKQKNSSADPNVLIQLERVLRERQNEQTLAKHIDPSKQKNGPKTSDELKESLKKQREDYEYYIQHFLPVLKAEITESKKLDSKKKAAIVQTILDITNRSSSVSSIPNAVEENIEDQMQLKHIEEQNNTQETPLNVAEKKSGDNKILSNSDVTEEVFEKYSKVVEEIEEKQTSKLSSGNDSDSGIDSPRTSEESSRSPVTSRRSSVSSTLSAAEKNNNLQKENENQMQPEQAAPEEPQVSSQCLTLGSREKESMDPNSQTTQMTGSRIQDSTQSEEKKDKKNTITTVQKLPVNEKKGEDISLKQPNNRNLHVALVTSCALSTIGCIVAGAMTSGLVGAGLLAMAAVFAIAAVAELHSNFLSSKLTSINVSPLVNDKELTAL